MTVNTAGTTGAGNRLLVLSHGYGADEFDRAPLTAHIDPDGRFFTVCPRGPHPVMGFGAGWYERDDDGGYDRRAAVVIGFSQVGAMTLASTLRTGGATRPAAIACLSGMLQRVDGLDYDLDAPADALPEILVQHGTFDPLVTIDRGHTIRDTLTEHGVAHAYREYPIQHEISATSLFDLRDWLAQH
ncbi:MAG: alpha/beta hydrolase [Acidimicrobiales bacterium]